MPLKHEGARPTQPLTEKYLLYFFRVLGVAWIDWIDIYFALWGDSKLIGRIVLVAKQHGGSSALVPAAACNGGTRATRGAAGVGVAAAGNTWPSTTSWQTMGFPGSPQVSKRRCP